MLLRGSIVFSIHAKTTAWTRAFARWICGPRPITWIMHQLISEIILGMGSANERRHYNIMPPHIGRAHTKNDPCNYSKYTPHQYVPVVTKLASWQLSVFSAIKICYGLHQLPNSHTHNSGLILGLRPANERSRYEVTPSLIGWAQT